MDQGKKENNASGIISKLIKSNDTKKAKLDATNLKADKEGNKPYTDGDTAYLNGEELIKKGDGWYKREYSTAQGGSGGGKPEQNKGSNDKGSNGVTKKDIEDSLQNEHDINKIKADKEAELEKKDKEAEDRKKFAKSGVGKKIGEDGKKLAGLYDKFIGVANGDDKTDGKTVAQLEATVDKDKREEKTLKADEDRTLAISKDREKKDKKDKAGKAEMEVTNKANLDTDKKLDRLKEHEAKKEGGTGTEQKGERDDASKVEDPGSEAHKLVESFKNLYPTISANLGGNDDRFNGIYNISGWYNVKENKPRTVAETGGAFASADLFAQAATGKTDRAAADELKIRYILATSMDSIRMPGALMDAMESSKAGTAKDTDSTKIILDAALGTYNKYWDPEDSTCQKAANMAVLQALYKIAHKREVTSKKEARNELAFVPYDQLKAAQMQCFNNKSEADAYIKEGLVPIDDGLKDIFTNPNFYVFLDLFPGMLDILKNLGGSSKVKDFVDKHKDDISAVIKDDVKYKSDPDVQGYLSTIKESTGDFKNIESSAVKLFGTDKDGNTPTDGTMVTDTLENVATGVDKYSKNREDTKSFKKALNNNSTMNDRQKQILEAERDAKDFEFNTNTVGKEMIGSSASSIAKESIDISSDKKKKKQKDETKDKNKANEEKKNKVGAGEDNYGKYHVEKVDGVVKKVYHEFKGSDDKARAETENQYNKDIKAQKSALEKEKLQRQSIADQILKDFENATRQETAKIDATYTGFDAKGKETVKGLSLDADQEKEAIKNYLSTGKASFGFSRKIADDSTVSNTTTTTIKNGETSTETVIEQSNGTKKVSGTAELTDESGDAGTDYIQQLFEAYGLGDAYKTLKEQEAKQKAEKKNLEKLTGKTTDMEKVYDEYTDENGYGMAAVMHDFEEEKEKIAKEDADANTKIDENKKLDKQMVDNAKNTSDAVLDVISASGKLHYQKKIANATADVYKGMLEWAQKDKEVLGYSPAKYKKTAKETIGRNPQKMAELFLGKVSNPFKNVEDARTLTTGMKKDETKHKVVYARTVAENELANYHEAYQSDDKKFMNGITYDDSGYLKEGVRTGEGTAVRFSGVRVKDKYTTLFDAKKRFDLLFSKTATDSDADKDESYAASTTNDWKGGNIEAARKNFFDKKKNPYAFMFRNGKLEEMGKKYAEAEKEVIPDYKFEKNDNDNDLSEKAKKFDAIKQKRRQGMQKRLEQLEGEKKARNAVKWKTGFDIGSKIFKIGSNVGNILGTAAGKQYVNEGNGNTMADSAATNLVSMAGSGLGKVSAIMSLAGTIGQSICAICGKIAEKKAQKAQKKMNQAALDNLPKVAGSMEEIGNGGFPDVVKAKQAVKLGGEGNLDTSVFGDAEKAMAMHAGLEGVAEEYKMFDANMGSIPSLVKAVKGTKGKDNQGVKMLQALAATKSIV